MAASDLRASEADLASSASILHIAADRSAWDFNTLFVRPVQELFQYRALIRNTISRDLKVRYKRSILGVAWTVLAPLMSMLVLWAVFTQALRIQIPYYALYLLSGLIVWNFFMQSSAAGCNSILSNAGLIVKIRLPRVLFPVTVVMNNLINFFFAFMAMLIVCLVTGAPLHWHLLLTPVILLPLVMFSMGWSMTVSALSVFFRDLQYLLEISLGAVFYLTPILYAAESVPAKYSWIVSFNPLAKFVHLFRALAYSGDLPSLTTYFAALGMGFGMFIFGWIVFQKLQRQFIYWL